MWKHLLIATALLASACGTTPDDRPVTFEFITLAVLAPSCGQVQCHSTSTKINGYAFDTLEATRKTLTSRVSIEKCIQEIESKSMPPDAPFDDKDLALLQAWVDEGQPGL